MSTRGERLLLVDDDVSAIMIMSRMLVEYDDQRFATSGEVALRLAREASPDLILLDADMPGMSGLEVCDALKADPLLAAIPVIFATSRDTTALQVAALGLGAADFIVKPLVAAQLTARVRAQLRSKQIVEALRHERLGAAPDPRPASAPPPRLLVVDDDSASIQMLGHTLAAMGQLHFAQSGEEALQLARRLVPDLILLDAHMPGLDGFDVCRALKAQELFRHVPIAFVTRFSDPRYETRALDLGAADFIAKPYTAAVLQARVRNLLDLKRRTDATLNSVREHWRRVGDARVADIVGAASDAIVSCDAEHQVVLINTAACRMFGVSHAQAIGAPMQALLGAPLLTDAGWTGDPTRALIARANAASLPVEVSLSQVGEGVDRLTTVMLRDISEREQLEAQSRSRIEAETANRTKTLMMSYIAHEMGNPLNGLLGFAQLMEIDTGHPLAPPQAQRLQHILRSGEHLKGLMRDVIDLGRFEIGNFTLTLGPVDAAEVVAGALAAVAALAEKAGVSWVAPPLPAATRLIADADRLHQCLVNLLSNAIKYNKPGGWVRVEIADDAQEIGIAVRDNGLGLDAAQLAHLFEPFNRLGRQRAAAPGSGLGLVITRQLVQAMNGRLQVDSSHGAGSCFTVFLPRAPDV